MRMNLKQNISSVALFLAATSPAWALSPQAEADMLKMEIKTALQAKRYEDLPAKFQRIADLKVGLSSTESFEYLWGQSCQATKDPACAAKHLETYINKFGSNGKFYASALELLAAARADLAAIDRELQKKKQEEAAAKAEDELYANLPIPKRPPNADDIFSEATWQELENSNAYRRYAASAKRRPIRIRVKKVEGPSYDRWQYIRDYVSNPMGNTAFFTEGIVQISCKSPDPSADCSTPPIYSYNTLGGLISGGNGMPGKSGSIKISKQSLFPIKEGSRMGIQINDEVVSYRTQRAISAKFIDSKLSGAAWEILVGTTKSEDVRTIYYLEDYGVFDTVLYDKFLDGKKCSKNCLESGEAIIQKDM